MRFGANYIPSGNWLHFWIDFDPDSVRADLLRLKDIGCDHIRAHLIWSYFQLAPDYLSRHCMDNLRRFTALCEETGMDFFLSLFTGWMSGFQFVPAWTDYAAKGKSVLTEDPEIVRAEQVYIRAIGEAVAASPRFLGFDLGNELTCLLDPEGDHDSWARIMFACCEEAAPGKLHNNGLDHQTWFRPGSFSKAAMAADGAITPLHCWILFTGAMQRYGATETGCTALAAFMVEYAKAYAADPQRPFWVQEFGISTEWAGSLDDRLAFMSETFRQIADCGNVWGLTWWCSHDLSRDLRGYASLEYDLGLLDCRNGMKPEAAHFKALCDQYRDYVPAPRTQAIVIADDAANAWETCTRFLALTAQGHRPAIIRAQDQTNPALLTARGIRELL